MNARVYDFAEQRLMATEQKLAEFDGGTGGGDNRGMEARIAKLESSMEYVQRDIGEIKTDIREMKRDAQADFRVLFGALITVALGLAALMAKGFQWL